MTTKYNHMLNIAFAIKTEIEDHTKIPTNQLIDALQKRVDYLKSNPEDAQEAFGYNDPYAIPNITKMSLYYGDNKSHEFWESEDTNILIIKNHKESQWILIETDLIKFSDADSDISNLTKTLLKRNNLEIILDKTRTWKNRPTKNDASTLLPMILIQTPNKENTEHD